MLFAAGLCILLATPCAANNSYFIPGDAFFYFEIDQNEWKALKNGDLTSVDYDRPEEMSFTLCGYAGYKKLDLSSTSERFHGQLVDAVSLVKEKYPTKIVEIDHGKPTFFGAPSGIEKKEINKIRVFVYNTSFDLSRFRIGLKYNESWPDTAVRMGFKKDHFRYDFFVPTPQGIAESWRMGSSVAPLKVALPDSERSYVVAPMSVNPAEVMFVVCPPIPLDTLCFPSRDKTIECFAVSQKGRITLTNNKGKSRSLVWLQSR
jgi:hypothetical protein